MFAAGPHDRSSVLPDPQSTALKRKRIVQLLSHGFTRRKRRCFQFSRLNDTLREFPIETIQEQIGILQTHVVVVCPTRRTVELSRNLSANVQIFLKNSCGFSDTELTQLTQNNSILID